MCSSSTHWVVDIHSFPTRRSADLGRMLAWFGVAAGAVYLIFAGGAWWGIYSSTLRTITMVIAAVALSSWAIVAIRRPRSEEHSLNSSHLVISYAVFCLKKNNNT